MRTCKADVYETKFQSTPPARGATFPFSDIPTTASYFNPRPPRGGRPAADMLLLPAPAISIHAPREGGDVSPPRDCSKDAEFQSTPPARGATALSTICAPCCIFQSTPPARGATACPRRPWPAACSFQSTPPARGATRRWTVPKQRPLDFNPRPPRGGRLSNYSP